MDYLSWQVLHPSVKPTIIVLNAVTMLGYAIDRIKNFNTVDVYFDNDDPGRNCAQLLKKEIPYAVDRSYQYAGYKDYNEILIDNLNSSKRLVQSIPVEAESSSTGRKR
jgi:5S rRNA maturation endonuclease (ribonuclease M5)